MGVIPNPKMAFIFPISCILALIFPIFVKYFPKYEGKGSFPKSQIKSLVLVMTSSMSSKSFGTSFTLVELVLGLAPTAMQSHAASVC